ncbi:MULTISPECIES: hypothetical protein [Streptomyces]|uniref:Secreted protein n=1 Tax=Streptomyces nigrescens TaxID=1920 RepID=A0ABY7IYK7_STRNI|nr:MULTISPECIES: hypothetical protein [Streptomyces]MCX5446935.1 hypothetical protein [Streptomyces libani]WAU03923.1 hypothetical protein STRNI_002126 [Streptomyces nigrescens]
MQFRHVRAVAACALVVVALTGARHSHGGGCGSSHSSSSSSSSSSGGYSSSDGGYSSSGSTTSSGTTTGGSPTAGSTTPPESDIRITDCQVDSAAGTLSAKLSVTNGNSGSTASYNGTVQFTDETGATFGSASISVSGVPAGQTRPASVSGTFIKNPNDQGPKSGKCKLGQVWKSNI